MLTAWSLLLLGLAEEQQSGATLERRSKPEFFCPTASDFFSAYQRPVKWLGDGFEITGKGVVKGNDAFNLIDGYVEFVIDTSNATAGMNSIFYTTSPDRKAASKTCDFLTPTSPKCMELDILKSYGNCRTETSMHVPGKRGATGCDEAGCSGTVVANGKRAVKASFPSSRQTKGALMEVTVNGQHVTIDKPSPSIAAQQALRSTMQRDGVQFKSKQWAGKSSEDSCDSATANEDPDKSLFVVKHILIYGQAVRGTPSKCSPDELKRRQEAIKATAMDMPTPAPTPQPTYPWQKPDTDAPTMHKRFFAREE